MGDAAAPAATNEVVIDGGPGLVYMPFVVMEDLLDKLKLLNYEEVRREVILLHLGLAARVPEVVE